MEERMKELERQVTTLTKALDSLTVSVLNSEVLISTLTAELEMIKDKNEG